jgi:hypothetical protein
VHYGTLSQCSTPDCMPPPAIVQSFAYFTRPIQETVELQAYRRLKVRAVMGVGTRAPCWAIGAMKFLANTGHRISISKAQQRQNALWLNGQGLAGGVFWTGRCSADSRCVHAFQTSGRAQTDAGLLAPVLALAEFSSAPAPASAGARCGQRNVRWDRASTRL